MKARLIDARQYPHAVEGKIGTITGVMPGGRNLLIDWGDGEVPCHPLRIDTIPE